MSKNNKFQASLLIALFALLGLSACGQDRPTATYYPGDNYADPDRGEAFTLPENEYAPIARTIFGYGGGVQDIYFDHYNGDNYRIRDHRGFTIAYMIRQPYGDYIIVNDYNELLFSLTYTAGDMFRIMDPLGFHYGFLNYNYEGSFVVMDTRQRMYHNVWFRPLYFSYPYRTRYYRDHRQFKHRGPISPPVFLSNPKNAPKNRGNRRDKKRYDDDHRKSDKQRRHDENTLQGRMNEADERERRLERYVGTQLDSSRPNRRKNYKAKPRTKTTQGEVNQTWSMGEEDIAKADKAREDRRSRNRVNANRVRQKQRQQAIRQQRQLREDTSELNRDADRQRAQQTYKPRPSTSLRSRGQRPQPSQRSRGPREIAEPQPQANRSQRSQSSQRPQSRPQQIQKIQAAPVPRPKRSQKASPKRSKKEKKSKSGGSNSRKPKQ